MEKDNQSTQEINSQAQNPLGIAPVGGLIVKFAIPAIISMLVSAMYNIVDQIFIGQGVGMLGNAATNVAFPVTTVATALALLLGIGGASNYNLEMGAGQEKKASGIAGTALSSLAISGLILAVIVLMFLKPLLTLFGATADVMPYAVDYTGITAFGLPFYILSVGGNHVVRADRSPTYSMVCIMIGAIINTILDPLFIFGFGWGIKGAAWATVIGQVASGVLVIVYFCKFRKMYLSGGMLKPKLSYLKAIISLGLASCINQIAMAIVQIVLNNILRYYGANSVYGSDIPIACVGVISKVNMVFMAICIGISQGSQPIWGFNYGAKKYDRVRQAYRYSVTACTVIATIFFFCFQIFPHQIVSSHGNERIDTLNSEANAIKDQTVYYDIRFKAYIPNTEEPVQLIINLEIQLNDTPGYPLVTRGFYYCARMISEQYGTIFTGEHYEKLQKVYSIWICPDPAKKRRNGIFRYHTVQDTVLGKPYETLGSYDLMEVVIVNLGDADKESDLEILDLLNTLFSLSTSSETKKKRLQKDFGIAMTEEFESEVQDMCNLGKALVEQGIEQGVEKKNLSLAKMMIKDKESLDKIEKYTGFSADKLKEIAASIGTNLTA